MKQSMQQLRTPSRLIAIGVSLFLWVFTSGFSQETRQVFEDFSDQPETRWEFIEDQVMGGKSSGNLSFGVEDGNSSLHLQGTVTTVNNGGFIQARRNLKGGFRDDTKGLEIKSKGNGEKYFIHIRTKSTRWPWQYYQCPFVASKDWNTEELRFDECKRSANRLPKVLKPEKIKSIAIVAFGREHRVDLYVDSISAF